jgi:flagellar hook-basal body complex protein FliE
MSGIGGIGGGAGSLQQIMALRQQILERSQLLQQLHAPGSAQSAAEAPRNGFGDALKDALQAVQEAQGRSEALTNAYERGEVTDIAKVMLARQESGIAFEATLQVRNRLLSAYQDIMRMGV